jgi:hypothetical protein
MLLSFTTVSLCVIFDVRYEKAHGNDNFFVVHRRKTHDKLFVCCAFSYGARQTYTFVVRFLIAHDKVFLKN